MSGKIIAEMSVPLWCQKMPRRMLSSSDHETPKKAVRGRPTKEQSCNDFFQVCRCNFKSFYGDCKRRVSTENLFEISK